MSLTAQWVVVAVIVLAAIVIPIYRRLKRGKRPPTCETGCPSCPLADSCRKPRDTNQKSCH